MKITLPLILGLYTTQAYDFNLKQEPRTLWNNYQLTFNKNIEKEQRDEKFNVFMSNVNEIRRHNEKFKSGLVSYELGINMFTDMTEEEQNAYKTGYEGTNRTGETHQNYKLNQTQEGMVATDLGDGSLPKSVDWRARGKVTPVRSQKNCGSCWAFGMINTLESHHAINTGKLVTLSVQQIVDCVYPTEKKGCTSGSIDRAYKYAKSAGGIESEETYPYEAKVLSCSFNPKNVVAVISGHADVADGSESELEEAVALFGPVAVPLDSHQKTFMQYKTGIYYDSNCTPDKLDHAMCVVGYGSTDDGEDYWILKNSWGEDWGEGGYMRLAKGKKNHCGIASAAVYPIIRKERSAARNTVDYRYEYYN